MQKTLNRNETLLGPTPKCLNAIRNFQAEHLYRYLPGYDNSVLKSVLAKEFDNSEDRIILSYGSEDFLSRVFESLDPARDSVLLHQLHFTYYSKFLKYRGIKAHTFNMVEEETRFRFDTGECISKYKRIKPRLIVITSPNNPTGNSISLKDLEIILQEVSSQTMVLIDEAYYGFDLHYDEKGFMALLNKYPNLVFSRSFSKLYALAGLRIGFALCGQNVKSMIKYQPHYLGMSRILEEVGIAAIKDKKYYRSLAKKYVADRESFISSVNALKNFKAYDSQASFVMIKVSKAVLPRLHRQLDSSPVVISKFVTDTLIRVSLDPGRYTESFVRLLAKVDREDKHEN